MFSDNWTHNHKDRILDQDFFLSFEEGNHLRGETQPRNGYVDWMGINVLDAIEADADDKEIRKSFDDRYAERKDGPTRKWATEYLKQTIEDTIVKEAACSTASRDTLQWSDNATVGPRADDKRIDPAFGFKPFNFWQVKRYMKVRRVDLGIYLPSEAACLAYWESLEYPQPTEAAQPARRDLSEVKQEWTSRHGRVENSERKKKLKKKKDIFEVAEEDVKKMEKAQADFEKWQQKAKEERAPYEAQEEEIRKAIAGEQAKINAIISERHFQRYFDVPRMPRLGDYVVTRPARIWKNYDIHDKRNDREDWSIPVWQFSEPAIDVPMHQDARTGTDKWNGAQEPVPKPWYGPIPGNTAVGPVTEIRFMRQNVFPELSEEPQLKMQYALWVQIPAWVTDPYNPGYNAEWRHASYQRYVWIKWNVNTKIQLRWAK